ncbi:MAG: hypothetical protein WDM89_01910 [Rhizomicrobium sp.]
MAFRLSLIAAPAALCAAITMASAAQLHWPLPPNSTERNGAPEHKTKHTYLPKDDIKLAPLPDKGIHPQAAQGLARRYSGTPTDVLRYHNDNYPTGWNPSETDLTPATVGSSNFGQLQTLNVDGNVLAQPLMVSNFTMPDNSVHNILIVATGNNTIYAYDAQTYSILWQVNLGTQQSTNDVGCGDIQGGYGISSTPVIVRNGKKATIYVVAATEPASFFVPHTDTCHRSGNGRRYSQPDRDRADTQAGIRRTDSFRPATPMESIWPGLQQWLDLHGHRLAL